jgi:hypothetical protein
MPAFGGKAEIPQPTHDNERCLQISERGLPAPIPSKQVCVNPVGSLLVNVLGLVSKYECDMALRAVAPCRCVFYQSIR